jgi:hypothetical protein
MNSTNQTTGKPDRPKRKRPNWSVWHLNKCGSLKDLVALSMNISPRQIDNLVVTDLTVKKTYENRLKAAYLEVASPNSTILVVERGTQSDRSDWLANVKSFVAFAVGRNWNSLKDEFCDLGINDSSAETISHTSQPSDRRAPNEFVSALIRLFVEISKRATKEGVEFTTNELPGIRKDLQELANQVDQDLKLAESSFNTYIKGLCKFKQGARSSDFYFKLFPELTWKSRRN